MRVDYSVLRPTADGSITSVANCTWQVCVKPPLRSTPSTGVASAARQDAKPKGVTSVVPACKAYWSGARRNTALSPTVDQTVELGPATALRGTAADPKRYWTWTSNNVGHHRGRAKDSTIAKPLGSRPSVHVMVRPAAKCFPFATQPSASSFSCEVGGNQYRARQWIPFSK